MNRIFRIKQDYFSLLKGSCAKSERAFIYDVEDESHCFFILSILKILFILSILDFGLSVAPEGSCA